MRFSQSLFGLLCLVWSVAILSAQNPKDWGLSVTLGNSVGVGTFVQGYAQRPSWTTSLALSPSYQLKEFWGMPRITLSAYQWLGVWWLDSYDTGPSDADTRFSLGDTILGASMSGILKFDSPGISLGASLSVRTPTSVFSQQMSRILGIQPSLSLNWSKWGFSVGYKPSALIWTHSRSEISVPCHQMISGAVSADATNLHVDQVLQGLSLDRYDNERLGGGECLVSGRQNIWSLYNTLSLGWSHTNHSVYASLTWVLNFLRALSENSELVGMHASANNFNEATWGYLSYSYTLPVETNISLTAGISSAQPVYDKQGSMRFPFFDIATPNSNNTQIFFQATVGI